MAFADAWAALHGEFSAKIPRTEYSADFYHWELMRRVTGIDVDNPDLRPAAQRAFRKQWDYGFLWNVLISRQFLEEAGARVTKLGHAAYGENDFDAGTIHPYAEPEQVYAVDPARQFRSFGHADLVARYDAQYRRMCAEVPDCVNMTGVYITLFSGLIEIFGWEALLEAIACEPDRFVRVIDSYAEWMTRFFVAAAASSAPVIMVHDDLCWTSGPAAHPDWYRKFIFPHLRRLIGILKDAGKIVMFTSDGKIDAFYADIVALNVDSVVMEPCNDMERFGELYGDRVGFVGGVDCRTLCYGTLDEIRFEVERAMRWGRKYPGFMLAVGNHLPADVPVERALYYNGLYESLARR